MNILAIETATENCSAALDINGESIQCEKFAPRKHTELILPMIDEILLKADIKIQQLDALSFGKGPGSFTGVRIATSVIQGLSFAHDIPIIPVSTLATLAQSYKEKHMCIATAIDARMNEVYWGLYKRDCKGIMQALIKEQVCPPENIQNPKDDKWFGLGTGWLSYKNELQSNFTSDLKGFKGDFFPCAKGVIEQAKPMYLKGVFTDAQNVMPSYLRNKIVS